MPRDIDAPRWADAACANQPDVMYPNRYTQAAILRAEAVCRRCPVVDACLAWAIDGGEAHGVWGAMTPDERRAEAKRRRWDAYCAGQVATP